MAEDFLTEFERALKERTNQLSPEERKLQSEQNLKKMAKNQTLSPEERRMKNRMDQLSPEERKIQSKTNVERMAKKQIDARNAKAQDYLDKSKARKMQSPAYRAGRASAQAQRTVVEGAKKFGSDLAKSVKSDIKIAKKAIGKVAPKVAAVGRASAPIAALIEGVRTAKYLTDEDYRDVNQKAYEEMAEKPALARAVEGGLGGMATILTQAKNLLDTSGAYSRAAESRKAAEEGKQRLIAKGILDEKGRPTRLRETASEAATEAEESSKATPQFDGEALSRALIEAAPVRPAEAAPDSGEVGAPRTPEVEAAYKEIEAGNVPKATVVDESKLGEEPVELDETRMAQLYRKTTGAEYNPEVSKAAREKMAQLKAFVSDNPDMLNKSDTRIALDFYKTLK